MTMKFYTYTQMNPGGQFDVSMPHYLIIEAESAEDADRRAEDAGAYFDGVDAEQDCECCGDRWTRAWEECACEEPCLYGEPVLPAMVNGSYANSAVRIAYANGAQINIDYAERLFGVNATEENN